LLDALPTDIREFMAWQWEQIGPYYEELATRLLNAERLTQWLRDWTRLSDLVDETKMRLYVESSRHADDAAVQERWDDFLNAVYPPAQEAEQRLKQKLLASGFTLVDFEVPLRNMRAQADLFRETNVPLLAEEKRLESDYSTIIGAQSVEWDGATLPLRRLQPVLYETDRSRRELAWRKRTERQLVDREAIASLWNKLLSLRRTIAANAGYADYRAYRWREMLRFDYTPDDTKAFVRAVEEAVVPATVRAAELRRRQLGVDSLRPWDLLVDPLGRPALKPFSTADELEGKAAVIFKQLDPQLGAYFETIRRERLLDLDNRKGKAPSAYCATFSASGRPFIFANAVGLHYDVIALLHESGHAFHVFEAAHLPYFQQRQEYQIPPEFAEVASHAMELLASPFLAEDKGGFYSRGDHNRAMAEHFQHILVVWVNVAILEAFQHWVYENPDRATDGTQCDAQWAELTGRFMPFVDWTGLDVAKGSGWQNNFLLFQYPWYNIEYGMAQLGAVQVWANALRDPVDALRRYRHALSLGGSASLPQLYEAAGAKFAFDRPTLRSAVMRVEQTLSELQAG